MPTPPLYPAAWGTLTNVYPLGISSVIIGLSLSFFSHISVMANMSMRGQSLIHWLVLFLTDQPLTERVFFDVLTWLCVEMWTNLHGWLWWGDLYIGLLGSHVLAVAFTDITWPGGEAGCTTGAVFIEICLYPWFLPPQHSHYGKAIPSSFNTQ